MAARPSFARRGARRSSRWIRWVTAALTTSVLLACAAGTAPAQDASVARQDLATSEDFRVRVSAALVLGRSHVAGSREALEHALNDPHPAVRTAAAAALGALGEAAAIPALERRAATEQAANAKAQMRASIDQLRAQSPTWQGARYVVQMGQMRNNTSVRGDDLTRVLHNAAKSRARAIQGAVVTDGSESVLRFASEKHLPVLTLDGVITSLTQARSGTTVTFHAQVEFALRKDQTLKGTLTGAATSFDSTQVLSNKSRVMELENDAVDGAVQSALRGADSGLSLATR
jgi:HEAT repeats